MKNKMKMIPTLLLLLALSIFSNPLFAKRAYINYPDKIVIKNIEYKAKYKYGSTLQKAYIEAKNMKTDKIIWKKKIYQIEMNPRIECDVQWIMITKVEMKNNKLIISNENKQKFSLSLETLEVVKIDSVK